MRRSLQGIENSTPPVILPARASSPPFCSPEKLARPVQMRLVWSNQAWYAPVRAEDMRGVLARLHSSEEGDLDAPKLESSPLWDATSMQGLQTHICMPSGRRGL